MKTMVKRIIDMKDGETAYLHWMSSPASALCTFPPGSRITLIESRYPGIEVKGSREFNIMVDDKRYNIDFHLATGLLVCKNKEDYHTDEYYFGWE